MLAALLSNQPTVNADTTRIVRIMSESRIVTILEESRTVEASSRTWS